jgi:hypothetical protein
MSLVSPGFVDSLTFRNLFFFNIQHVVAPKALIFPLSFRQLRFCPSLSLQISLIIFKVLLYVCTVGRPGQGAFSTCVQRRQGSTLGL